MYSPAPTQTRAHPLVCFQKPSSVAPPCRFVASHPLVASSVVGATTVEQLEEILQAAEQPWLELDVRQAVDAVHQRYPNPCP